MQQSPLQTAIAHWAAGRREQARAIFQQVLRREPGNPTANQILAADCYQRGELEKAQYHIDRAIASSPGYADFHFLKGMIRNTARDPEGAMAALGRAIELDGGHLGALTCLGTMLSDHGKVDEAEATLARAIGSGPLRTPVATAMSQVLCQSGRAEEGVQLLHRACAANPADPKAVSVLAFTLNYLAAPAEELFEVHRRFGALTRCAPRPRPGQISNTADPERRLRVGFVSADLRTHSVAFFAEPVLEWLDRESFEMFVYSLAPDEDAASERLRSLVGKDRWRRKIGPAPEDLPKLIRGDRIDVLIDLAGHSADHRLDAFAARSAPVQATWLGYPNTTGLAAMDYRIVDSITDPTGAESPATERLVRIDPCFVCYRPPDVEPPRRNAGGGGIRFGSFNNPAKISGPTVALWSRLLQACTGSRLVLKGRGLETPSVQARFGARFAAYGLDPSRIEMLGGNASQTEHLAAYGGIDIALDPLPYNGATTTCDALWMDVPVVTLRGDRHAARVGASLLDAAGLPELVAGSEEEYIRIAAALTTNPARLAAYHAELRARVRGSALCDAGAFAARFGGSLREMWRAWCAS